MFAVIETGGKQYIVAKDQKLKIEKLPVEEGKKIVFDKILLVADGDSTLVGKPYVEKAKVEGTVLKQGRARKINILRYHNKTRQRKRKGHRQPFTEVQILSITK
jgi:large subunit ribosomal protein L21